VRSLYLPVGKNRGVRTFEEAGGRYCTWFSAQDLLGARHPREFLEAVKRARVYLAELEERLEAEAKVQDLL